MKALLKVGEALVSHSCSGYQLGQRLWVPAGSKTVGTSWVKDCGYQLGQRLWVPAGSKTVGTSWVKDCGYQLGQRLWVPAG